MKGPRADLILAVVLTVVAQVELWAGDASEHPELVAGLYVLVTGSVAFRRAHTLFAIVVALAANGAAGFIGGPPRSLAEVVAWLLTLYALAVWTPDRHFRTGATLLVVASVAVALHPGGAVDTEILWITCTLLVLVLVRTIVLGRERRAQDLVRDAVAAERTRIARELHDVVAHGVSVMVVQAGTERATLSPEQTDTRDVLGSIERTGREALGELRRLLGLLRTEGEAAPLAPTPGLDRFGALLDGVRDAGLRVEAEVDGERRPLPPGVDVTAYRILQEALTNTLRHAAASTARVRLAYEPDALTVEVLDDGLAPATNDAGHGLIGMRERVAVTGGTFEAMPRPEGGFAVRARLPT